MRNLLATAAEESRDATGSGQTAEHIRRDRHCLWPTFITSSHADEDRTCISIPLERTHAFMIIYMSFKLFTFNPNQTPLTVNLPLSANIFIKQHLIRFLMELHCQCSTMKLRKKLNEGIITWTQHHMTTYHEPLLHFIMLMLPMYGHQCSAFMIETAHWL